MSSFRNLSTLILFLVSLHYIKSDYFSSITGLENLLSLEDLYLESLESHMQRVEEFTKEMGRFLDEVEVEQLKIQNDSTRYFDDPVNAFKTIKRFSVDWKQMEDFTRQIQGISVYNEKSSQLVDNFTLPTDEDLKGAARGLARLQHIYKFSSKDIAEGQLGNRRYNTKLTSFDCFVLGQSLYESKDNLYASEWLIEAMHRLEDEDTNGLDVFEDESEDNHQDGHESDYEEYYQKEFKNEQNFPETLQEIATNATEVSLYPYVTHVDILEYLGAAVYNAGNRKLATLMNDKLLAMDSDNTYGLSNKDLFHHGAKEERRLRLLEKAPGETKLHRLYAQVCSGELQQSPREKRHLRCRYVTNNAPYYFVGPAKMEELNLEPFVAYYHQIISDNVIDQIIKAAVEYLERSEVGDTTSPRIVDARISKGSWLRYEQHPFLKKLLKRLEDITGLSMESCEPLQVANYGIGGHYDPHMDASLIPETDYPGEGNRMLTALFFINDVELGGATVFPILRLAVPPLKNNLLVWYNLHKSGDLDYRTAHAACPVIKGSKWITNQWFHSYGQEFKRRCDLQSDTDASKQYVDYDIDE